ncbi:MAG: FeoA family protein [Nitrososphaeria archaeon]
MELPLTALKNGESGVITSVKGCAYEGGQRGWGRRWGFERRLADMGLTPGTLVTVVKSAPLQGPVEVLVRGSRLALGRGMAERIYVVVERERKED